MKTSWPWATSSCTPIGVMATRYSWFLTSLGTPTFTGCDPSLPAPVVADQPALPGAVSTRDQHRRVAHPPVQDGGQQLGERHPDDLHVGLLVRERRSRPGRPGWRSAGQEVVDLTSAVMPGELYVDAERRPVGRLEPGLLEQLALGGGPRAPRPRRRATRPAARESASAPGAGTGAGRAPAPRRRRRGPPRRPGARAPPAERLLVGLAGAPDPTSARSANAVDRGRGRSLRLDRPALGTSRQVRSAPRAPGLGHAPRALPFRAHDRPRVPRLARQPDPAGGARAGRADRGRALRHRRRHARAARGRRAGGRRRRSRSAAASRAPRRSSTASATCSRATLNGVDLDLVDASPTAGSRCPELADENVLVVTSMQTDTGLGRGDPAHRRPAGQAGLRLVLLRARRRPAARGPASTSPTSRRRTASRSARPPSGRSLSNCAPGGRC